MRGDSWEGNRKVLDAASFPSSCPPATPHLCTGPTAWDSTWLANVDTIDLKIVENKPKSKGPSLGAMCHVIGRRHSKVANDRHQQLLTLVRPLKYIVNMQPALPRSSNTNVHGALVTYHMGRSALRLQLCRCKIKHGPPPCNEGCGCEVWEEGGSAFRKQARSNHTKFAVLKCDDT